MSGPVADARGIAIGLCNGPIGTRHRIPRRSHRHEDRTAPRRREGDGSHPPSAIVHYKVGGNGRGDDDGTVIAPLLVDLLWTIYPIEAPEFIRRAIPEHIRDGFIDVEDKFTNLISSSSSSSGSLPRSYAIGDCCRVSMVRDGGDDDDDDDDDAASWTLPKAGEFAWKMGMSVADDILRVEDASIDRTGECIAELGLGRGIVVRNDFTGMMTVTSDGTAMTSSSSSISSSDPTSSPAAAANHRMHVEMVQDYDAKKMHWVNSYLRRIFGEGYCLSLRTLLLNNGGEKDGGTTTTTTEVATTTTTTTTTTTEEEKDK